MPPATNPNMAFVLVQHLVPDHKSILTELVRRHDLYGREITEKTAPLFHYALNTGGFLLMGSSETVGTFGNLFISVDRKLKLYRRREYQTGTHRPELGTFLPPLTRSEASSPPVAVKKARLKIMSLREIMEQVLLNHIVSSAALINLRGDILYLHGRTSMYLEPTPGEVGVSNILKMAREGLRREMATALRKAIAGQDIMPR